MATRIQACGSMQRLEGMTSLLLATVLWVTGQACATPAMTPPADAATQAQVSSSYGKLPLSFEINRGQTDAQVKFLARGQGYGLFLTPREAVLSLRVAQAKTAQARKPAPGKGAKADEPARSAVVRMRLAHANSHPELSGLDPVPGTSNYFIGNDPGKWQTEIAHYARVKYAAVYPGIDLVYHGNQRQLEYDFVLAPGADPKRIELVFEGARRLSLDKQGNLVLATAGGELVQRKPVVYQEAQGKRTEVEGRYVLRGRNRAGFHVASYDTRRPLVIDPVLSFSTYLGGSGEDRGYGIAVDASGNAYVTGTTASSNFSTTAGAYQRVYGGGSYDAFVTKLNATGTALTYSTYLGGSGDDEAWSIAVDAGGNVYLTGLTDSSNFPTTAGTYQTVYSGGSYPFDAFVAKLNAGGTALVYSTYLGGSGGDYGYGIAVDGSGNAYVTGSTGSSNFPTTAGAYQTVSSGGGDAFVTKLNAAGTALVYSTLLGGSGADYGADIAVDGGGNVYVMGPTASSNFPTTAGAYQTVYGGGSYDAFVTKLNATGTALLYSSLLGGSGWGPGFGITLDGSGNAYVTGYTASSNFPTTAGAYQRVYGGGSYDAFVTKLNATGTALVYSTYLGGSGGDGGNSIVVDASGNAYLSGTTVSSNFPTTADAHQFVNAGGGDAFVTKLNAAGSAFVYSTYLGGTGSDSGPGIAMDGSGNVYVTGYTLSSNFPTTSGAYQIVRLCTAAASMTLS